MTAGSTTEFGVYVPQVSFTYPQMLERARVAEGVGFDSLWLYDHLYSPGQPELASLEGWTLASYLLAQTTRLRVGHLVLCNNFRHPALLAKMATTLDVLSGGRLELGIGSGSVKAEHVQSGMPWGAFPERSDRLAETLEILTRMFTQATTTFTGRHYQVTDLPNLPAPVQTPHPPIHIGGIGPLRTLPLVARYADVWNIPTYGLAGWEASKDRLEEECARIGRDPVTIRRSHEAVLVLAPDQSSLRTARAAAERRYGGEGWGLEAGGYVGTPSMVRDRIAQLVDKGISLFVFFTHDRADPRTLELFAETVMSEFN
ncbi:MAG TPA: LLM class flavin-dependent oxidoreductase [Acidimicrobiales bacterium]|jgi:alkanesulfonate monooxygenase SsuD/methylene tetrahydromethanopterin reductase-like flavin-dependent oxidoreductase (luciferase family)|nr:LLM class flavin-dependent oxidoreductase [Acidimicrobiales bacterium]